jgi:hypothetical protein
VSLCVSPPRRGVQVSFDLDKNSHINIDRNNVLMNNSILSIGLDKENVVRIDNGIVHIEINSISIFYDNTGALVQCTP